MKTYKTAIILLAIVIVLLSVLIGVGILKKQMASEQEPDDIANDQTVELYRYSMSKINKMEIDNAYGTYTLEKLNNTWKLSSDPVFKTDNEMIETMVFYYSQLMAERVIDEDPQDLSQYGLTNPITMTITQDDGMRSLLKMGGPTPTQQSVYVMLEGDPKVYTLSVFQSMLLIGFNKNYIIYKTIFPKDPMDFNSFYMERNGQTMIDARREGEGEGIEWLMNAPIRASVGNESLGTIFTSLTESKLVSLVKENPTEEDLKTYGLDNPSTRIRFTTDSKNNMDILLGNTKTKDAEIYAMIVGEDRVITLNPSELNFIDKPLREMVEVFVYITYINDVEQITVKMDGNTVVSKIQTDPEGDRSKDRFWVDGKEVTVTDNYNSNLFRKYYQGLIGITLSDIDVDAVSQGKAEISFEYKLKKEPYTVLIEFISKDEYYYYVMKNGEYTNMIVGKDKFNYENGPRKTYTNMIEAMINQELPD